MNSSTLRRLALDHASLHKSELPPNYLFPPTGDSSAVSDDLTQLTILLTGPEGTPYSEGLWKLHLRIPEDYPKSSPKAAFRTRIWHPNVEEKTGSVCVDTLKKDWDSNLTLRDILVTISCLLIQPNPDSALNSSAGHLLKDDYESFARQAKLMTSIHARIPTSMKEAVLVAKRRGETESPAIKDDSQKTSIMTTKSSTSPHLRIESLSHPIFLSNDSGRNPRNLFTNQSAEQNSDLDADSDDEVSASKENDPSLSPSPVAVQSPRKSTTTKRPLSDLPTPTEPLFDEENPLGISSSDRNIANNMAYIPSLVVPDIQSSRKALKLTERSRSVNFTSCGLQDIEKDELAIALRDVQACEDDNSPAAKRLCSREEKENINEKLSIDRVKVVTARSASVNGIAGASKQPCTSSRTSSLASMTGSKGNRPRVGLRRL